MQSNLLIGNGLNIHFGITDLKQENIFERFKDVLLRSSPFYELLFKVKLTTEVLDTIFSSAPNIGIETLAYSLYTYIRQHMYDKESINSELRLLDSIKTSAINAIFFKDNKQIDFDNSNPSTVAHINEYDNIFTLNYYEAWDISKRSIYLHGYYDMPDTKYTNKRILLYDGYRYGNVDGYDSTAHTLRNVNNLYPFYGESMVFSPLLDKQEVLDLGKFPSEHLYPANDLFPSEPHTLYTELDNLQSLEIFGMSPFGDEKLIEKIKQVPNLSIYVYQMNEAEVSEWNRKLNRKCCKDSSLFAT